MGYQGICRLHDDAGGAVVAFQAEEPALGVVLLEIEYVLDFRAAEGVDGLAVVPHHADVVVELGQLLEYQVLAAVGILVLVNHYIGETVRYRHQGLPVVLEQIVHVQEYVVEVHHPALLHLLLVELVYVDETRPLGMQVGGQQLAVVAVAVDGHEVVFGHRNARQHLLGFIYLVVQGQLLDAGLDGALGVGGVVDGEVGRVTEGFGIFPEEADKNGVEGAHHQLPGGLVAHHIADSLLHLPRRLLGEGKRKHPGRIHALGQYICYSAG